jgi:hypothetical protein
MTFISNTSLPEITAHLAEVLAHQETLLDPEFDPAFDDLEREFAELRLSINRDLN